MSEKITAMIEEIKGLSVLELSELVHALESPPPARSSKRRPSSTSS